MNRPAVAAALLIGLVVVRGAVLHLRPVTAQPACRDPATAEPWMADALPGIGAKRRESACRALRAGRFDQLPAAAQEGARAVFLTNSPAPSPER